MRISRFTLTWPLNDTLVLAFNTLSGSAAVVDKQLLEKPGLHGESATQLEKLGIAVDDSVNEDYRFKLWLRKVLSIQRGFSIVICPTLRCNLACSYCYERRMTSKQTDMTHEMAEQCIAWLDKLIVNRNLRELSVNFFGGEPLLCNEIVRHLAAAVSSLCSRRDVRPRFSITTNGTLCTKPVMERVVIDAIKPHEIAVQVTLDGPKEVHDARRPFRDHRGASSFDAIIDNLCNMQEGVKVSIRITVDKTNLATVPELLTYVSAQPFAKNVVLTFAPTRRCGIQTDRDCYTHTEFPEQFLGLWEEAARRGFRSEFLFVNSPCMETHGNGLAVGPDGSLYTCLGFIGVEEFSVGNISSPQLNEKYLEHICLEPWQHCRTDCPLLPICLGGCRHMAWTINHDWRSRLCEPEALENAVFCYLLFKHSLLPRLNVAGKR